MHQISKQLFMLITLMLTSLSPAMAEISYPTNPLYQPKRLIISQNGISSFDLQTGRLVWQKLNKLQTFEPVLTGEYLLVGSSQGLQVLSAKTGQLLWQHGGGIIFSPIVENNTAYLTARDGRIWALDLTTQKIFWQRQFDGWLYPPTLKNGVLVVGGQGAELWGINPVDGELLWQQAFDQELIYQPQAGQELIFITTYSGDLLAISPTEGGVIWQKNLDATNELSPILAAGNIYLPRSDGIIQIMRQHTGRLLWLQLINEAGLQQPVLIKNILTVTDNQGRVTYLKLIEHQFKQMDIPGVSLMSPWVEGNKVYWQPSKSAIQFTPLNTPLILEDSNSL